MQRKNSILTIQRKQKKMRNGMAMIMAIVVLVVIATLLALSLSMTTQTTKRTTDLYLYEQAVLLSQSASEAAMLQVSQANPCTLSNINYDYEGIYHINVDMKYIAFSNAPPILNSCFSNTISGTPVRFATTTTPESDGTIVMDITVTTINNVTTEPLRYFRRTLQKM